MSEPKRFKLYDAPHALNAEARRDRLAFLVGDALRSAAGPRRRRRRPGPRPAPAAAVALTRAALVPLDDRVEDHEEGVLLVRLGLVDDREAGAVREELVELVGGPAREDDDPPAGDAALLRELEQLPAAEERQLEVDEEEAHVRAERVERLERVLVELEGDGRPVARTRGRARQDSA